MNQDCACLSGASRFTVASADRSFSAIVRSARRPAYRKPFADVTYFWGGSVTLAGNQPVEFHRHRAPPAMRRGRRVKCSNPVVSWLGRAPGLTLCLRPLAELPATAELPPPDRHIFYDRCVADVADLDSEA